MQAMRPISLVLAVLVAGAGAFTNSDVINTPVTVPFDQNLRPFNEDMFLAADDQNTIAVGQMPTQVHLSPAGDNAMFIGWATGHYQVRNGTLQAPQLTASVVEYGYDPADLMYTANGTSESYAQIYPSKDPFVNITNALNYTSPVLHSVMIEDLMPNATVYYKVGNSANMSQVFQFRSLNDAGTAYPQRILAIADWGLTMNSSSTLMHMIMSGEASVNPPVAILVGDHVYADTWYGNGTHSGITGVTSASGFEGQASGTCQPVWDAWFNFIQPIASEVPFITATGNHEIEQQFDSQQTTFASVMARWKTNGSPNFAPDSYHFHSSNVGPTHNIVLSVYVDYRPGSPQWTWLAQDLAAVDRTMTPWVTVSIHNPWYTTDSSYKQFEQMRVSMEPLTYQYGVDVFWYGHVHSYERTAPVHNYIVDPCGAVHITIGDAGNGEGISGKSGPSSLPKIQRDTLPYYEDANACPNVTSNTPVSFMLPAGSPTMNTSYPFSYYTAVLTFQANGNSTGPLGSNPPGYCYSSQPLWSQYRESSFGHGVLDVVNATHAYWQWHRNQDSEAVSTDSGYIIRNTTQCPNKLGAAAYASGMMPGVTMSTASS